jgi:glycosyltransferase involved in cell wall biosynthesis
MKIKVFYDGYFFNQETYGGISRMWKNLWDELFKDVDFQAIIYVPEVRNLLVKQLRDIKLSNVQIVNEEILGPKKIFLKIPFLRNIKLNVILKTKNIPKDYILHSTLGSTPMCKCDRPVVVTVHHLNIFRDFPKIYNEMNSLYFRYELPRSLRVADKIIAISESTKNDILRYYPKTNPSKIEVIYHGLDQRFFSYGGSVKKLDHDYLLFVGGRNVYKNLETLLQALAKIKDKFNNLKLILVGPDTSSDTLKAEEDMCLELGIRDHVINKGMVSDDELISLYANARALVVPSLIEGFGFPLLEGLACGCPVIASDIPVFRELGKQFVNYFNPNSPDDLAEKLEYYLANEKNSSDKKNGQEYAATFTWEKSAHRLKKVYQSLT